jgi:hypothetical protein
VGLGLVLDADGDGVAVLCDLRLAWLAGEKSRDIAHVGIA